MLVEIPEGVIGLSFDMLADAKLVLTDALIAESLAEPQGAGVRARASCRRELRPRMTKPRTTRKRRPKPIAMRKK